MKVPKINYHVHTSYSGDVRRKKLLDQTMEKYILSAINLGFTEICFTEHLILDNKYPNISAGMNIIEIENYAKNVSMLAKRYPEIKIKCGIELDWTPNKINDIRKIIEKYNFDCILGSVHVIDNCNIELYHDGKRADFWGKMSEKELFDWNVRYYHAVQELAKSRICDVIAHVDLIKRDAYLPVKSEMPIIKETLEIIAKNNLCIEVNTSGLRKPIKEMHPTLEILKLCNKLSIPVTIGTDAHRIEQLDYHFEDGMKLIKSAGYNEIAVFDKRKRSLLKL